MCCNADKAANADSSACTHPLLFHLSTATASFITRAELQDALHAMSLTFKPALLLSSFAAASRSELHHALFSPVVCQAGCWRQQRLLPLNVPVHFPG
jgi:hypothetical protein